MFATFKGEDKSCGFRKGQQYLLSLNIVVCETNGSKPSMIISDNAGHVCMYSSLEAMAKNWDLPKYVCSSR